MLNLDELGLPSDGVAIVYDGDCPLCSRYAEFVRLKGRFGKVHLINARSRRDLYERLLSQGYDLDEGMLAIFEGRAYYGSDAIAFLSDSSTNAGLMAPLRSPGLSAVVYPFMLAGRNLLLKLLGKTKLREQRRS